MILSLAQITLFFPIGLSALIYFFPIHVTKRQIILIWMTYIVALGTVGAHIKPSFSLDLYRTYGEIDAIRNGSSNIFSSALIIRNTLEWLVSKTDNNGWLVFISVVIWGLCIVGIINEYLQDRDYSSKAIVIYFLAANGGCYIVYLLSGVFCSLAVAIWNYGYYKWYDNNKKLYLCCTIFTCFLHPIGIVLGLFAFLYFILNRRDSIIWYIITFVVIIGIGYLLNTMHGIDLLNGIGLKYTDMMAIKLRAYSIRGYEFQQGQELLYRIITSVYLFICIIFLHFNNVKKYEIFGLFILVMFAGFNMSIIFERMPYALGICSLPILNETITRAKPIPRLLFIVFGGLLFGAQVLWGVYECSIWLSFV